MLCGNRLLPCLNLALLLCQAGLCLISMLLLSGIFLLLLRKLLLQCADPLIQRQHLFCQQTFLLLLFLQRLLAGTLGRRVVLLMLLLLGLRLLLRRRELLTPAQDLLQVSAKRIALMQLYP